MRLARTSVLLAVLTAACSPSPDVEPTASSGAGAGDAPLAQDHRRRNVEAYRAAVRANPSDGEARFRLAQALVENGDWGAAAPEAIRAADLLPDRDDIQVLAVSMLLGQQRFAEALDRISPRRAANPGDPRWHILFGNATAGLPNSWSAIEHYDREWRSGRRLARIPPGQRQEAQDQRADEAFRRAVTLAPGRPEATTALGNLAWARGRMREGNAHLRRVADQNPHDVLLNRALGLSYLTADQHQDAETYLRAAAASGEPDSVRVLADFYASHERLEEALTTIGRLAGGPDPGGVMALHAARLELRLGRPAEALGRADRILQRDPDHPDALVVKAQALLESRDIEGGLAIARHVRERDPGFREARLTLARALLAAGRQEEAFDELSAAWRLDPTDEAVAGELARLALALDRPEAGLALARDAVRLDPGSRDAATTLVRALVRLGDTDPNRLSDAERTLTPLLAAGRASAEVLALQAALQAARRQPEAARATYLAALRIAPDSLEALSGLVALELAGAQAARVRPYVARALAAHKTDPEYLLLSARVASAVGDRRDAELTLKAMLGANPGHPAGALFLADLLAQQNRGDEARTILEQALARRPASIDVQLALARIFEDQGQVEEARRRYERLAAPNRQGAVAYARLAALHANEGGLDMALTLAATAKRYLPDDPAVNDTLGWVYVRKGVPALGIPLLEDAVQSQPGHAPYRYHLGTAYQRTGQHAKARDQLSRALGLDPGFPGAADAEAMLAALPK